MDDQRFSVGLLDMTDAARFLGIPRVTFHRWARGYPHGGPLLHVLPAAPGRAQVPFIAVTEAHVLEALRLAGVRPAKIRPALKQLVPDPYRAFGQPIFEGSRARVWDVANMLKAGEDPQVVADEHGVSIDDVRTAARVLLGHTT